MAGPPSFRSNELAMNKARHRPHVRPLKLPHERDESADATRVKRPVIKQAARDVAAGMIDTDNYTRISAIVSTGRGRRRPRP